MLSAWARITGTRMQVAVMPVRIRSGGAPEPRSAS